MAEILNLIKNQNKLIFNQDFNRLLTPVMSTPRKPVKIFDQVQAVLRMEHHSIRTKRVYQDGIKRKFFFHHKTHPAKISAPEVEAFLLHLAVAGMVAFDPRSSEESAAVAL